WLKSRVSPDEVIRMETVKQAAAELGKSSGGAAFGTGMVLVPPLFQPAAGALVVCPNCQAHISAASKFCPSCGQNMTTAQTPPNPAPGKKCSKCNSLNAAGATFCQNCGTKLT